VKSRIQAEFIMSKLLAAFFTFIMLALSGAPAGAQTEITWFTIDGGGATSPGDSAGGGYAIAGTIGQSDAASTPVMAGGALELTGGFWPVTLACTCPGDMNGDGMKNGLDVQKFVSCSIVDAGCSCADMDAANGVDIEDVAIFVEGLLMGSGCP
jgi:hypothetical protein